MKISQKKIVLYADDDPDDKSWVVEACKALDCNLQLQFVENGHEVMGFLSSSQKKPSLIVLDLNMPEMDGRQTLKQLKSNPDYQKIPVAIVTTSSNKIDRDICQRLGAELYLIKPYKHAEWQNIIRQLEPIAAS